MTYLQLSLFAIAFCEISHKLSLFSDRHTRFLASKITPQKEHYGQMASIQLKAIVSAKKPLKLSRFGDASPIKTPPDCLFHKYPRDFLVGEVSSIKVPHRRLRN